MTQETVVQEETPKTKVCTRCSQSIKIKYFTRHTQIHQLADNMSQTELLASMALTNMEILNALNILIQYERAKAIIQTRKS